MCTSQILAVNGSLRFLDASPVDCISRAQMAARSLADTLPDSPQRSARRFSWAGLKQAALSAAVGGSAADVDSWDVASLPANFFDLTAADAKGAALPFEEFRGQVMLVCNVASF